MRFRRQRLSLRLISMSSAVIQDMITSFMNGYPGELFEEPFVDFSTTRNYALRVRLRSDIVVCLRSRSGPTTWSGAAPVVWKNSVWLIGVLSSQKHGQKTAYAFMVDADFAVNGTWRLRIAAQRMQQECQHRSVPYCAKALQIRIYSGTTVFFTTRVFPSQGLGTADGWQYFYPVHEVHAPPHSEGAKHLLLTAHAP